MFEQETTKKIQKQKQMSLFIKRIVDKPTLWYVVEEAAKARGKETHFRSYSLITSCCLIVVRMVLIPSTRASGELGLISSPV